MKVFVTITILSLTAFQVILYSQTVPTTLREMFGEKSYSMETESLNRRVEGSWKQGANMPFPRYYSGSVMYTRNDTLWLYVFGGDTTGGGHATTACLRYNVNTDKWEYVAPLPVPMRVNAAVRIGDKLYTMGGFSAPFPSPALTDFYEYDINSNTWIKLPDIPLPLFFHGAESFEDSLIYILGGIEYTPGRGEVWSNKVFLYNIFNQSFRPATDLLKATAGFGHARYGTKIFITAGLKSTTELWNSSSSGEVNISNREQINWTLKANYSIGAYAHYGAPFPNNEIYYAGGSNTTGLSPLNLTFEYKIDDDTYQPADPLPINWMAAAAGFNFNPNQRSGEEIVVLVVAGGITSGPAFTSQTWVFTDTVDVQGLNEITNEVPESFSLLQNYPNPFNPSTTIQFALPKESFTKLEIFNALGEKVSTLVSETLSAGTYEYEWETKGLPSGIYFYRLKANHFSEMKKMVLLR